jgi:hypothetical protein
MVLDRRWTLFKLSTLLFDTLKEGFIKLHLDSRTKSLFKMASSKATPPRTDYFQRLPQLGITGGKMPAKNTPFVSQSPYALGGNSK